MPANVLSLLTRMRQIALHPGLIPRSYLEQLRAMGEDSDKPPLPAIPVTPADRIRLQAILARAIEEREECPVCFDIRSFTRSFSVAYSSNAYMNMLSVNDPRITSCAHIFCLVCISEVISRDPKCPMVCSISNFLTNMH